MRNCAAGTTPVALAALAALMFSLGGGEMLAQEEPVTEQGYEREELGVNRFTAPSIAQIFDRLDRLRPLPFDQLWRELPAARSGQREHRALVFGNLIADGFLIVEAERRNLVDELGRVLIREARALGVAEQMMKHSASLTELGKRGDWPAMKKELVATQADVEQALVDLRDQKMAHLISLGGWLRALEISADAVVAKYSPERAAILAQPELLDYFDEELGTLPPQVAHDSVFEKVRTDVKSVHEIVRQAGSRALSLDQVKSIAAKAHDMNLAVERGE